MQNKRHNCNNDYYCVSSTLLILSDVHIIVVMQKKKKEDCFLASIFEKIGTDWIETWKGKIGRIGKEKLAKIWA